MTSFITTLTLVTNIIFILFVLAFAFDKSIRRFVMSYVHKYVLEIIFAVSLGALVFSWWYSNIVNFPPCELCWIQRIFMYPQVLLSFLGILKKDKRIVEYLLPMTIIGGVVALYQSLVHWGIGGGFLETGIDVRRARGRRCEQRARRVRELIDEVIILRIRRREFEVGRRGRDLLVIERGR
jgi:hypothetical protein